MPNNFNDNTNKKGLGWEDVSYTTYRTNYSSDEMMRNNGGMPPSSCGELEDNKEVTIDAMSYTEPVVVKPSTVKDAMKQVTVTISNLGAKPKIYGANLTNSSSWDTKLSFIVSELPSADATIEDLENIPAIIAYLKSASSGGLQIKPLADVLITSTSATDKSVTVTDQEGYIHLVANYKVGASSYVVQAKIYKDGVGVPFEIGE